MEMLRREGDQLYIRVPKEVDHCFADELRENLDRQIELEDIGSLIFDFSETEFMDSSGIGMLMGRYKIMKALGGTVRGIHVDSHIFRILSMSGIHKIIPLES